MFVIFNDLDIIGQSATGDPLAIKRVHLKGDDKWLK
jgi:hypothetical protein